MCHLAQSIESDNELQKCWYNLFMLVVGLMSGTSLDGIDVALIETDGERIEGHLGGMSLAYECKFRDRLRACLGSTTHDPKTQSIETELTDLHANAVSLLLDKLGVKPKRIGLIGFHGHTICHQPEHRFTWQLGDGAQLANVTGIDVVCDFRSADVAAGGEGAPLSPAYHYALCKGIEKPLAILNLGGVANVTWLGDTGSILAFDTGPANALIDDWMDGKVGIAYDQDGRWAAQGISHTDFVTAWLNNDYFSRRPPKSLDRDFFNSDPIADLSIEDGAATLTEFTVKSIQVATQFFPSVPLRWLVTGGGRKNTTIMQSLISTLELPCTRVESLGWNGDLLEAEAFAFLALRSKYKLPISWPSTTGVPTPLTGGRLFKGSR